MPWQYILRIGNTNFEPQSSEMLPVPYPPEDFVLLISRPVLQKTVLNCYDHILNFIHKKCVEYCFLFSYIRTYIISLIWPPDLQSLSYLPSGLLQKGYADSCSSCVTLGKLLLQSLFSHLQNADGADFMGCREEKRTDVKLLPCVTSFSRHEIFPMKSQ